jgi:hypothetical protein
MRIQHQLYAKFLSPLKAPGKCGARCCRPLLLATQRLSRDARRRFHFCNNAPKIGRENNRNLRRPENKDKLRPRYRYIYSTGLGRKAALRSCVTHLSWFRVSASVQRNAFGWPNSRPTTICAAIIATLLAVTCFLPKTNSAVRNRRISRRHQALLPTVSRYSAKCPPSASVTNRPFRPIPAKPIRDIRQPVADNVPPSYPSTAPENPENRRFSLSLVPWYHLGCRGALGVAATPLLRGVSGRIGAEFVRAHRALLAHPASQYRKP